MSLTLSSTDELKNAINSLAQRFTEYAAAERGLILNDVLRAETLVFDVHGVATRTFPVTAGCVCVFNESTTTVLVTNQPPGNPGKAGVGQAVVRAGTWKLLPLVGATFTVYGRPAESVGLVAMAKPTPPAAGTLGDSPYHVVPSDPTGADLVTATGVVYTHPWASAGISAIYGGVQLRETTGVAGAQFRMWDGDLTGNLLEEIQIGAGQTVEIEYDKGFDALSGSLYVELVSGALSGSVRVR